MKRIFKDPPLWLLIIAYLLTIICISGSIVVLVINYKGMLSYIIYALSALTLAYSIYTIVRFAPKIKAATKKAIEKNSFASKYVKDFGFRSFVGSVISFSFSILFGISNGVLGIVSQSIWYGSLSLYYILLTLMYGSIISSRKRNKEPHRVFKNCGILLMVLNSALSVAIAQMIFDGEGFEYSGIMIYVYATYAFYKLTTAIIKLFKSKHKADPISHATVCVNLTGGMVCILALQTALLSTFGNGVNASLFNTLTGSAVSLTSISISIFMIIKGTKNIKLEKTNESKQI